MAIGVVGFGEGVIMNPLAAHLPDSVQELLTLISIESVIALVEAKGGLRVYIPDHPKPDHWLLTLMPEQDAKVLCARYKGTDLDVPRCATIRIVADKQAGMSVMELAKKYGVTWRTIYNVLSRAKVKNNAGSQVVSRQWVQTKLFEED